MTTQESNQTISKSGTVAPYKGPPDFFTGDVTVAPLFSDKATAPFGAAYVTFAPGARSFWHVHPAGQHLVVTDGMGWTGDASGGKSEIRKGDVVWCPPGVKHWHGAAPHSSMTHLALTGVKGGQNVEWMEPVTDEQYGVTPPGVRPAPAPARYSIPDDADNFYQSENVTVQPVRFLNQYRMGIGANLFIPETLNHASSRPAIIVGHPMGAVKEQSANLYATKMAERGFVTLSIDLPFWGDSEGEPRNSVSPDLYAEAFSAAADYLGTQPVVDRNRLGVIGICGSGSFAISAAKIDSRLKAIATISMYDMGEANRRSLGRSQTLEQRQHIIAAASAQRTAEFSGAAPLLTGGCVHEIDENSHPVAIEFFEFYRTPRGAFTPKGQPPERTTHPTLASNVKFMNFYPFNDIETISPRPLLFIAGANAHSLEFSREAYRLAAEPKELLLIPGAGHVDLYDRVDIIPFDQLAEFFTTHLQGGE